MIIDRRRIIKVAEGLFITLMTNIKIVITTNVIIMIIIIVIEIDILKCIIKMDTGMNIIRIEVPSN